MKTNLPDFCVSSEAKGFDEFLKVYKTYFNLPLIGDDKYYGVLNKIALVDDKAWTTNIITPQEAIALLTEKQLTVEDLKVENRSQPENPYEKQINKIVDDAFEKANKSQPEIVGEQEEFELVSIGEETVRLNIPVQEDETFHEFIYQVVDDTVNGKYSTTNAVLIIDEAVKKQTATLHEQLKEAKEKMFDFVEWSGNKYQKFHDKWTLHCVDVYKTTNTFYTTEELFELYIQEKIKSTNS